MGPDLLSRYLSEAKHYATANQSLIFCGDLNALTSLTHIPNPSHVELIRHRALLAGCGSLLLRADTGPEATRPANPSDSTRPGGNILDHILGAHVDFADSACLSEFVHTSDHHPIFSKIVT